MFRGSHSITEKTYMEALQGGVAHEEINYIIQYPSLDWACVNAGSSRCSGNDPRQSQWFTVVYFVQYYDF